MIQNSRWAKAKKKEAQTIYAEVLSDSRINGVMEKIKDYDVQTYEHGLRTGKLISELGVYENYDKEQLKEMIIAGCLLNIGYIRIPKKYITKEDHLNAGEFQEMKNHPKYGAQIAREIGLPISVQQYIFDHHESPDGNGYPCNKSIHEFMTGQLEINLADIYMALQEPRAYRSALSSYGAYDQMAYMATTPEELKILESIRTVQKIFDLAS